MRSFIDKNFSNFFTNELYYNHMQQSQKSLEHDSFLTTNAGVV